MDIISEPEYLEEKVMELDLVLSTGSDSLTLRSADTIDFGDTTLTLRITQPQETIIYYMRHVIAVRMRERIMRRKKDKA